MGFLYISLTILFTVYDQFVLKWRMNLKGPLPENLNEKFSFMFHAYIDLWIILGFLVAFLASLTCAKAMTKFQLSQAYPIMSLSYILVFCLSVFLFNETVSFQKIIGFIFIFLGVLIIGRSSRVLFFI